MRFSATSRMTARTASAKEDATPYRIIEFGGKTKGQIKGKRR